jgi:phage terminase large subunit-like protein
MVHLAAGMWISDCTEELLGFPKGSHDDQVDTMTGGLQLIGEYELILAEYAGQGTVVYDERVSISPF